MSIFIYDVIAYVTITTRCTLEYLIKLEELLYDTKHSTAYDVSTNLLTCVYNAESMGKITLSHQTWMVSPWVHGLTIQVWCDLQVPGTNTSLCLLFNM